LILYCGAALLLGGAVFSWSGRGSLLIGLMLFIPFLDRQWKLPTLVLVKRQYVIWAGLLAVAGMLLFVRPDKASFFLSSLALAALPEEWFFRAWFMTRLGSIWRSAWLANVFTSILFSLVHLPLHGPSRAFLVFFPSLFFGWLFQRYRDLALVILLHGLSNLLYVIYLVSLERQLLEMIGLQ